MGLFDNVRSRIVGWMSGIIDQAYNERVNHILDRREYRIGKQKEFIKRRQNQPNYNVILNLVGLIVDRSVSMLFGKGIRFDYGEGGETVQEYIDGVYDANKWKILLHRVALFGAESGMCFVKLIPRDGLPVRMVALDPVLLDVTADPDDWEKVIQYIIQYRTVDQDDKEIEKREITTLQDETVPYWEIRKEINKGGRWQLEDVPDNPLRWGYTFPPIVHWQNLPNVVDVWGMPDITSDVILLQDVINKAASNINKIIHTYAHPRIWGRMIGKNDVISMGPDDMVNLQSENALLDQLPPVGDMGAAVTFFRDMRQSIMDITRTVDVNSMAAKLGDITNFGLHVLYQDALSKLGTKRELYEEGLCEVNRRLLVLDGGYSEEADVPVCVIVWPEPLPENETEEAAAVEADLRMGIVSKQTISEKREYDWEDEQQRMTEEGVNDDNIGARLLRDFDTTGGV